MQCSAYLAAHVIENRRLFQHGGRRKIHRRNPSRGASAQFCPRRREEYGLEVIAADIQNTDNNCTRFIVISREAVLPEDAEKISLCFSAAHSGLAVPYAGAAFRSARPEPHKKSNPRPIPERNFEYDFYLDFTGNVHDVQTLALICALSDEMPLLVPRKLQRKLS